MKSFSELGLSKPLLQVLPELGFEKPSHIQEQSIPLLSEKPQDFIGLAQTGTGKTAAFGLPLLDWINTDERTTQALILAPTRELGQQIAGQLEIFAKYLPNIQIQSVYGGASIVVQMKDIKRRTPQIVIATPGRLLDLMRRKVLDLSTISFVVLDEADEMLSSGFKEQIYNIFQYLAKDIQIALFSATMPSSLYQLTEKFMRDPIKIIVKAEQLTLEGIKQYFVNLEDDNMKYDTLKDLFSTFSVAQCIIYCNSVRRVSDLFDAMNQDGYPVCQIHSSLDKAERQKNYDQFRSGNYRVLISSNVTARGIDIQQVSTVINFDIPKCSSTYLHRIGRSGRWGRKGVAINFITRRDYKHLKEIESFYQTQISELPNDYKGT